LGVLHPKKKIKKEFEKKLAIKTDLFKVLTGE
jgi:hypothetical protein